MCRKPADDARRLASRVEALGRFVREDLDAGDLERAEASAVAAIDAAAALRELLGGMCAGHAKVAQLIA